MERWTLRAGLSRGCGVKGHPLVPMEAGPVGGWDGCSTSLNPLPNRADW